MATKERKPPKLGPKKNSSASNATPKVTPRPSNAGLRKASSAARPSASPAQPSSDVPKKKPPKLPSRQGSEATIASRKPPVKPRRASNFSGTTASVEQERKPPKLEKRQSSLASDSSQTRKPSIAQRKPSNLSKVTTGNDQKRKPPKLGPKKTGDGAAKPQAQKPSTTPKPDKARKPSTTPKPSQARKASTTPKPNQALNVKEDRTAHKVDEQQQDLKSILSIEQCEDLVQLTASITNRMRRTIEDNFNATATLKYGDEDSGEDRFASLDYDPGTVDVEDYDKEKKLREERQKELSTPKVKELKEASLKWLDDWREGFLKRVDEAINPGKTSSLQLAQKEGTGKSTLAGQRPVQTMSAHANAKEAEKTSPKLEQLFPRVPTSLTKMTIARRELVLHSFLLLLLSLEHYNAASRVFLLYLASSLKLGLKALREDEEKTAKGLLEAAKQISASKGTLAKGKESEESRKWKMRLATVAGAAIVGLSGGYAAPMIAASVGAMMSEMGLGASAAAGYLGAVAGNTYLVGSLFGAYGGRMTGEMMRNLSADVDDFAFLPVHGERKEHEDSIDAVTDTRRLRVVIAISGWLLEKEEVVTPWKVLKPSAEVFALRFELETLMRLGQSINTMSANDAYGYAQTAFNQRSMVTDLTSVIWPLALVKIARVVENPFNLAKARADKAGKVLADALINHTQGERPVTLIGYSTGARVIYSCLTTLAERKAFGLVESVVMLGAPVPSDIGTWRSMRTAVSGRLVNVYSKNDYLLAFLYRTASLQFGVAGLMPISGLSGVENFDVSETVSGHLRYRYLVGSILQKIGFEDIDKDEVAKEAEAFKAMAAEEEKHDYVGEVKESASEMFKKYAKRGKQPPLKKISDKEADKQVSAMEKEVRQKTQKGLMQWAVEQLYLSRPSAPSAEDIEKAKADPEGAIKDGNKTANKTADAATKSMYQRAVDAVYISRSGGPKGQDAAKSKIADAKGTAGSAAPSSYLATAAGYIPTSYIPGFGAGSTTKDTKQAVQATKQVGAAKDKGREVGKASEGVKKVEAAPESPGNTVKPATKRTRSSKPQEKGDSATEKPAETVGDPQEVAGDVPTAEDPSSTDTNEAADDASQAAGEATSDAQKKAGKEATQGSGYGSYIPSFGFGSSSKNPKPAAAEKSSEDAGKPATEAAEPEADDAKASAEEDQGKGNSTDTTPTKPTEANEKSSPKGKQKSSGYGSYIPSFGFGGPKSEEPSKPSVEPPADARKDGDEAKGQADEKPKDAEGPAESGQRDTETESQGDVENETAKETDGANEDTETELKDDEVEKDTKETNESDGDTENESKQDTKDDTETESWKTAKSEARKGNDDTKKDTESETNKDNAKGDMGDTDDEHKSLEDPFVE